MMKKLTFLTLILLLPLLAYADPVSELQALTEARQFMKGKTFDVPTSRFMSRRKDDVNNAFFVFNADEGGYVVVSADDRTTPILGYSPDGRLDMDALPANIQSWLDGYTRQIEWLRKHPEARAARRTVSGTAISPLLGKMEWGQSIPFNGQCPTVDGKCCLTGCVATAMAQVMRYHQWPAATTKEIPSYTTRTSNLTVDAIPVGSIDWGNMLDNYSPYGADLPEEKQAVAALMKMCGAAAKMDYGVEASGAYMKDAATALKDYFDYDATTSYIMRSNYGLQRWSQRIYDELAEGRPVIYGGTSIVKDGAHAFVIDGYDKDDYFHVNWGWNGQSNAYFLLTILDPDGISEEAGYSQNQEAIVGIQKNTGIIPDTPQDGEVFTELTPEGVEMTFKVISAMDKICQVGDGEKAAIDWLTKGSITIPSMANGYDVIAIGDHTFDGSHFISSVVIPSSIESIGRTAFQGCHGLDSINIPASVTSIDNYAFENNGNLKRFVVDAENSSFMSRDGILYNKSGNLLRNYPTGLTGEFTIPADVPYVNSYSFYGSKLKKLTIPETVLGVGGSIASWSDLTTIVWNASKTDLPSGVFFQCFNLETIELCEGLTIIPDYCFGYCAAIKNINIPKSVQTIGKMAFDGCRSLENITFSTRLSHFGQDCFRECTKIKDIVISYESQALFLMTLPEGTFPESVYQNATLHVPVGSGGFFRNADEWKKFQSIVEDGEPMPDVLKAEGDIWGYYANEELWDYFIREYDYSQTNVAMFIPGDEAVNGAEITAIRVATLYSDVKDMEKGTIWLSETLSSELKVREMPMEMLIGDNYTEYVLEEPYTITDKGIYVGFSCPSRYVYVNLIREGDVNGGFFREDDDGIWHSNSDYRLCLQVRLKNHHLPEAAAFFDETKQAVTSPEKITQSIFPLNNDGKDPISSIDYTITIDGVTESRHQNVSVPSGIHQNGKIAIDITGPVQPNKIYTVSLTLDKVNGKDNTSLYKTLTQQFRNMSRQVTRRTVMEEGTGTWCLWCPRGMAAMQHAKDIYGDRFIGIAVHNSSYVSVDPMDINSYPVSFSAFPSCKIDRSADFIDPYLNTFSPDAEENLLEAALQVATDVDVTVSGVWNEDKTQVTATSITEFLAGGDGYSVAYVLVADGVKHDGKAWFQVNGYSGNTSYASDPYLKPFVDAPNPMTDVSYNDVVIASSYRQSNNLANPYTGGFSVGERKTNSYTLTLPTTGELAEAIDKDQVYVIAIVTNADGTIANAAKSKVTVGADPVSARSGDVNSDGVVNDADVDALVNSIMKRCIHLNADVNADSLINVTDIAALTNILKNRTKADVQASGNAAFLIEDFTIKSGELNTMLIDVNNEGMEVADVEFFIQLPHGLSVPTENGRLAVDIAGRASESDYSLEAEIEDGVIHVVLYSTSSSLTGTEGTVIRVKLIADDSFPGGEIILKNQVLVAHDETESKPQDYIFNVTSEILQENIDFADAAVKAICVEHWDVNGDGELSKSEAAMVKDIGTVFKSNRVIKTFDELQYFTGLGTIGESAFSGCSNLASVFIPNSVTDIKYAAFADCSSMVSIVIPNSVKTFGNYVFQSCNSLTSLFIPSSVVEIGWGLTLHCSSLISITVDDSNPIYDSRNNCNAIIEKASSKLMFGCNNTVIPNTVRCIAGGAFDGCSRLEAITIPNSVILIERNPFTSCDALASVIVESGNTVYDSRDNCNAVIETATNRLVFGCKKTIIPNTVNVIGQSAFNGCKDLQYITLPGSVKMLDSFCFSGCEKLNISFSIGLETIGESAFQSCRSFTTIVLPNTVKTIGRAAFNACNKLTAVTIPNSVSEISKEAFAYCRKLDIVKSEIKVPFAIPDDVFNKSYNEFTSATLYVPKGTKHLYETTAGWKNFTNIVEEHDPIQGDLNGDDAVDLADIAAVISAIASHTSSLDADVNGDGVVNIADIAAIISIMATPASTP